MHPHLHNHILLKSSSALLLTLFRSHLDQTLETRASICQYDHLTRSTAQDLANTHENQVHHSHRCPAAQTNDATHRSPPHQILWQTV